MAIDTKRLRYFIQVAESGSLSKAAEELYIAQPALSRQIHMLEDYLGFQLFTRTGRGMSLTQEGRYLRDAVASPLRNIELATENMRSYISRANKSNFSLGIGIHSAVSPTLTTVLVKALEHTLPDVRFRILEGTSFGLYEGLKHGALDYAVLDEVFQNDNLSFRLLQSEHLMLLGTAATAAGKTVITLEELTEVPLILPCSHQRARKIINKTVHQTKLSLDSVLETDSTLLMLDLVQRNRGLALLSQNMARTLLNAHPDLVCINIEPSLIIDTYLASRGLGEVAGSMTTLTEKTITETVKQQLHHPS